MGTIKPILHDFELEDGEVIQCTRNFAGLYMLKAYNPEIYDKSQIMNRKKQNDTVDDLELADIIYAAYVTAQLMKKETEIMPYKDFLMRIPEDGAARTNILKRLYGTEKKRTTSPARLKDTPRS